MKDLLKRLVSFGVGFLFCWIFGDWVASWIKNWSAQYVASGFDTAIYWTTYIGFFIIYFGFYGIQKIPAYWNGVPLVLGQPVPWYKIPSGYFWQLPHPFMGSIGVFMGQRNLDIPFDQKVLSKDNIGIKIKAQVQARVSNPYKWASVEDPDKALETLVEQNIRIYTNTFKAVDMPGQKVVFSQNLERGVEIPTFDSEGNITGSERIEALSVAAEQWGYGGGIDKCIINDIQIPEEMVTANVEKEVELAQFISETTQQNLFFSLLGDGGGTKEEDIAKGREIWAKMSGEERAKILQAERGKRKVVTVDGNAGDFTKGGVAGAEVRR